MNRANRVDRLPELLRRRRPVPRRQDLGRAGESAASAAQLGPACQAERQKTALEPNHDALGDRS